MDATTKRVDVSIIKGKLHLTQEPREYFQSIKYDDGDVDHDHDQHYQNYIHDEDFHRFLSALRGNHHIHYVLLERRFVRNLPTGTSVSYYFAAILEAISQIPNLAELEIWSVRVPITTLCQVLPNAKSLFRLGLGLVTLTADHHDQEEGRDCTDCSGLAHHPTLQYFYLSDFRFLMENAPDESVNGDDDDDDLVENEVGDDSEPPVQPRYQTFLDSFWQALATCPRLHNVEVFSTQRAQLPWSPDGLAHLANSSNLCQLTLRRLRLTSADVIPFANRLAVAQNDDERGNDLSRSRSGLRVLNLHENKLKDDGCIAIARAVSASNTIRELDLRDNHLSVEGGRVVIPLLTSATCGSNFLVLEKLKLANNPIEDEGALLFAEALEQGQQQQQQSLSESTAAIICRLKHLDLSKATISDAGCCRLARALMVNSTLVSLDLGYNNMTNDTYLAFGDALRTANRTLVSLNLQVDRTKVEPSGCAALLQMVEENYVLETLTTSLGSNRGYDPANKARYGYYIRIFLRLNHAGRRKLLEQRGTKADWIKAIVAVQDSLHAIYYLISTNPSLCQRNENDTPEL
ncbi:hypothetical protein ACA910_006272 [Epithemia clementina (nom. ined.)]